jgi:pga67 protein
MKKQFFVAAMAVALGAGLTACSSDNLDPKDPTTVGQKASTYMSVSFELPAASGTRAADDKQDEAAPEFNNVGKWAGQDKVKKVAVYVFNGTANTSTLEVKREYDDTELSFTQNAAGKAVVNANKAFKVEQGQKTVFVVVNPTTATKNLLEAATVTNLQTFKDAYESANLAFTNPSFATAYTANNVTRADELATVEGTLTDSRDVIVMTGASVAQTIDDNVSAQQAISGLKNRVKLEVQRAVARVVVTTKDASYNVEGVDPNNGATIADAATVSDLTYVVAQGENTLYFLQKSNGGADGAAFTTPAFSQIPGDDDYWTTAFHTSYKNVGAFYDYSGLWKHTAGTTAKVKGVTVPSRVAYSSVKDNELANVTNDLKAGLKGEFVLPTLHKYVDKSDNDARKKTGYRKGNTAYILVRGHLTPKFYVDNTGAIKAGSTLTAGADLYLGANGIFYADAATVTDATKKGVVGQTAQKYVGGKVLYFVWLNPDDVSKAINSPVIRNNIYHVQIKAIGKIGANWNPLVPIPNVPNTPGGKIDPKDPTNPINNNPNNPDPRPKDNPNEPNDPPVDPKDPLSFKETWMSVNVSILPWQVHSYEVELTI